jgi:hypothetical protein
MGDLYLTKAERRLLGRVGAACVLHRSVRWDDRPYILDELADVRVASENSAGTVRVRLMSGVGSDTPSPVSARSWSSDGHGNQVPDWSTPDEVGCGISWPHPRPSGEDVRSNREHGVKDAWTLYGPADADIVPGDAVEFTAARFRVVGPRNGGAPGTVLDVERWDG